MTPENKSPLHEAAQYDEIDTLKHLLDQGMDVNSINDYGHTPLYGAVWNGHTKAVRILIDRGANINAKRVGEIGNAWTPLHGAAENDQPECARLLLEAGAAPDPEDENGQTPLFLAAGQENNHESMRAELVAPDVARLLIEYGASIKGTNVDQEWTGIDPDSEVEARLEALDLVKQATHKMIW